MLVWAPYSLLSVRRGSLSVVGNKSLLDSPCSPREHGCSTRRAHVQRAVLTCSKIGCDVFGLARALLACGRVGGLLVLGVCVDMGVRRHGRGLGRHFARRARRTLFWLGFKSLSASASGSIKGM